MGEIHPSDRCPYCAVFPKVQFQRFTRLKAAADAPGNRAVLMEYGVHREVCDGVGVLSVKEHPERADEVGFVLLKAP